MDGKTVFRTAQKILSLLPDAYAEISPSGTGLHLFFTVPAGFVFDRGRFYINNRKTGVEIYLPCATKHFMTVTGNTYRTGNMRVSEEQMMSLLNGFMKRRKRDAEIIAPPEGESVLSDTEVIQKLSSEPDGQRFMDLFRGDWENAGPDNNGHRGDSADPDNSENHSNRRTLWSQSEADMSLCLKLAFYCRGDMEQMDRLFRKSGLMRDKWDRSLGASTYGAVTLQNAVNQCNAFYEPPSGGSSADEDFMVIDYAVVIDDLLGSAASDITADMILSEDILAAAAWAYRNDTLRYTKMRQAVPKVVRTALPSVQPALVYRADNYAVREPGKSRRQDLHLLLHAGVSRSGHEMRTCDRTLDGVQSSGDVRGCGKGV